MIRRFPGSCDSLEVNGWNALYRAFRHWTGTGTVARADKQDQFAFPPFEWYPRSRLRYVGSRRLPICYSRARVNLITCRRNDARVDLDRRRRWQPLRRARWPSSVTTRPGAQSRGVLLGERKCAYDRLSAWTNGAMALCVSRWPFRGCSSDRGAGRLKSSFGLLV